MAGYRLTFDGSLNERRDVVQSIGNSSLSLTNTNSPAKWDNITALDANAQTYTGGATAIPAGYTSYKATGATSLSYSGGNVTASGPADTNHLFMVTGIIPAGSWTYEIRWRRTSVADFVDNVLWKQGGARIESNMNTGIDNRPSPGVNWRPPQTFTTYYIPITSSGSDWFSLRTRSFAISSGHEIDYIRIYNSAGVTILNTTFTNGVAPTGGVSTAASPSTIIDGQGAIAGAPKLFGAKVVHDAADVLSSKYLPPATVSQDAEAKVSKEKYITATATSISVEGEGLGGADKLGAGRTSIVVENVPGTVEN